MGMSPRIEAVVQIFGAWPEPAFPVTGVGAGDGEAAVEGAFEMVRRGEQAGHDPAQVRAGDRGVEGEGRGVALGKIEGGRAVQAAAVEFRLHPGEREMVAHPFRRAGNAGELEAGPLKRAALDVEAYIGGDNVIKGDDAAGVDSGGLAGKLCMAPWSWSPWGRWCEGWPSARAC